MRYIFVLITVLLIACSKKNDNCDQYTDAKVLWTGPLSGDGCEWVIYMNGTYMHPDYLPQSFQENDKQVKICYKTTKELFHCGLSGTGIPVISVKDIKKK